MTPPEVAVRTIVKPFTPDESVPIELSGTEMTTGRFEPAVSIEWVGSGIAKVGQDAEVSLVIKNISTIPVQQVAVHVRIPPGLTVLSTTPRAVHEEGVLAWEVGILPAKQETNIQFRLHADTKGDLVPRAWVTFTGGSAMRIRVREPKLSVKVSGPEKALIGEAAVFSLSVSNPGDGSAEQVRIQAVLSEGLEHPRGNRVELDVGTLGAGESRNVNLMCTARSGGSQSCEVAAVADGGLTARDGAKINVIMPRLNLQLVGPGLRYLDRKAMYVFRVTNPGDAPANNVNVADIVPSGLKVLAASDGGRHDYQARTVSWYLGDVAPGQTREVKLEVQAVSPGEHHQRATAVGARGLRSESELLTRVEGLSAMQVEMVDTDDPVEVNGETAYEVKIANTGSKTESDVRLVATIPEKMQLKDCKSPVTYREEGRTIIFEPIRELVPKADAVFRINVKALEPGTVLFKIQVTSATIPEAVIKTEATRIYADTPDATSISRPATSNGGATRPPQ